MSASSVPMTRFVPSVVVVDPRFDAYRPLAASARLGKLELHFRSSGREALKMARRMPVDAWLIAPDLDDMSGYDLVPLLQAQVAEAGQTAGHSKVAFIDLASPGCRQWSIAEQHARMAGVDSVLSQPITFHDLEQLLGLATAERAEVVSSAGSARGFVALPVGVGAAVIAIAVLMMG
jgi:CheY-like chemotaxis protein